jgi:putative PIN family toxin of toxin-antitoxin system
LRILLDTNILIRAAISTGVPARRILNHIIANPEHTLIVSSYLLGEVAEVLTRTRISARYQLSREAIDHYSDLLANFGGATYESSLQSAICDPKDQSIIEAAVHGRADIICTTDKHFYTSPAKEFLNVRGVVVLRDEQLIRLLEGGTP